MSTAFIRPEATATITVEEVEHELTISEGKLTLADDWSPYIQGVFTVPLVDEDLLEQIDPRMTQRVLVNASDALTDTGRILDLGLRLRTVDHKNQTIDIEVASDEALLLDRKNGTTTVDKEARDYESSLRDVCSWALDKIDAELEAGTDDADLTARWTLQNAIPNPLGLSTGAPVWLVSGNCNLFYSGGNSVLGNKYVVGQSQAAGQSFILIPQTVSTKKGDLWNFSAYMHRDSEVAGLNGILRVYEMGAGSENVLRQIESAPVALPIGTATPTTDDKWVRLSLTFTVQNPNTTRLYLYASAMANVSGRGFGIDRAMLTQYPAPVPFFSGATASTGYTSSWAGTAHQSVSERVPSDGIERLPELFNWKPGTSLWDFLQPLLEHSGLRFFCDEERKWRLVNPTTYEVPGFVTIQSGHNATNGEDTITRNDNTWADCVVCVYRWTDADGISQEAYDAAGDPEGKCVTYEYEREFPGIGAAAYLLSRLQGRGRTQEVTALTNYLASPGMDVMINLPGTYPQIGKIREVIFDLKTGLMDVGTRELTEALPGSWVTWDAEETWSEVDPDMTWNEA